MAKAIGNHVAFLKLNANPIASVAIVSMILILTEECMSGIPARCIVYATTVKVFTTDPQIAIRIQVNRP